MGRIGLLRIDARRGAERLCKTWYRPDPIHKTVELLLFLRIPSI